MKVTGPGSGVGAVPGDVAGTEAPAQAGEKPGVDRAAAGGSAAAEGTQARAGVARTTATGAPPPGVVATHDIAADLRAGTLAPGAAMEKLIDRIVSRQLGPSAPAALRDNLRAALQETIATDPMLAAKVRSLGRPQDE